MSRRDFPKSVKVAVIRRATKDGVTYCEGCGSIVKRWQVDHIRADGLLGEPRLENAQLLGPCCYGPKNANDKAAIAEAVRREAYHWGVNKKRRREKAERPPYCPAAGQPEIARRFK
jgi:hypothetical protein